MGVAYVFAGLVVFFLGILVGVFLEKRRVEASGGGELPYSGYCDRCEFHVKGTNPDTVKRLTLEHYSENHKK